MGLFSSFFQKSRAKPRAYCGFEARSTPFNRELYEQETVRAIIDCIASHAAKAEAMHIVVDENDRVKEIKRSSPYARLLNRQPNPLMSGYDLKYKLVTQMEDKTTALAYIKWNGNQPEAILPVNYTDFEFYPVEGGGYAVEFTSFDGEQTLLPVEDVVILRRFFNTREVAGDGNAPVYNTLSMIKASDEGLTEALNVSNKVRGILSQKKAMLAGDDVKKSTEEFTRRFEEAARKGGIVGLDSMEEFTPLSVSPWSANAAQMKEIRSNLFYYWRISEPILTSNYTESQWQAFYESVIEPILIQMGQAFTNACFTPREIGCGNRIIFNTSVLLNASMQTKVNLLQNSKEIGLFTNNELRELFGYSPVEGGDERVVSLNYIKGSDQSSYQVGAPAQTLEETPEEAQSGAEDSSAQTNRQAPQGAKGED